MAGGRPTAYGPRIVKAARSYLDDCHDEEEQQLTGLSVKGTELYKTKVIVRLPTVEGLAVHLRVHKDTIYEWEKLHPEFSDVMGELRSMQADRLVNNGLSGIYNPTIAKVLLTKHGYREGIENTGEGGGPIKHDITGPLDKVYGADATGALP